MHSQLDTATSTQQFTTAGEMLLCALDQHTKAASICKRICTLGNMQTGLNNHTFHAVQVIDGYFVKYGASCVALLVYAMPIYLRDPRLRGSQDDITQDYVRAMRLLQNTSRCCSHTDRSRAADMSRLRGSQQCKQQRYQH